MNYYECLLCFSSFGLKKIAVRTKRVVLNATICKHVCNGLTLEARYRKYIIEPASQVKAKRGAECQVQRSVPRLREMQAVGRSLFCVGPCFRLLRPTVALHHGCKRSHTAADDKVIIKKDADSGIATMYLNNPPVNQMDSEMLRRQIEAIKQAEDDSDIKGIVITSKFDGRVFSAGLNLYDMYQKSHQHVAEFWSKLQDWQLAIYSCEKPTVACINGHAPAGGCVLALMCEYRIMQKEDNKLIGMNEVHVGVAPPFSVSDLLARVIGQRAAERAVLTGRLFTAEEALAEGIIDAVADLGSIHAEAKNEAEKLLTISPPVYAEAKMALRRTHLNHLRKVREEEADMTAKSICSPEMQEVMGRYLDNLRSRK